MKSIIRRKGIFELELAQNIDWESFNDWAESFVERRKGKVTHRFSGSCIHVWEISISNISFDLFFTDYPDEVWIQTENEAGEEILREIASELGEANHV